MSDRPLRKRTYMAKPADRTPVIEDELEYLQNKCSYKARKIDVYLQNISIHIWFDKHYLDRVQHGDYNGKREGIEQEAVMDIVVKSIKHLLFYGAVTKGFIFLNFPQALAFGERAVRVVCAKNGVNVVIEAHFLTIQEYEITIKTAIKKEEYKPSDNQYIIELLDDEHSILSKFESPKLKEIYTI